MLVVPATEVRLLSNVPLSSTYEHQMTFGSKTEQATYFTGKSSHTFLDFTYVREDGSIKVPKSRDTLYNCNYLMFKNTDFGSKWFYAFVTKLEYVNPTTTKVHFDLDVYQTWQFDFTLKPSYVEREHQNRWNADGTPVINTLDEGLNYGTDYDIVDIINYKPNAGYKWLVIVTKTPIHYETTQPVKPVVLGTPQPLSYYIVPFLDDDTVPNVYLTKNNVGVVVSKPSDVLRGLYTDEQAVNNVVSLYVTDYTGLPCNESNGTLTFPDNGNELEPAQVSDGGEFFNCLYVKKSLNFSILSDSLGNKYDGYNSVSESKLLMYPYTQLVFADFKGNMAAFKNEYINSQNLTVRVKGSLGVSNKVSYALANYNSDTNSALMFEVSDEHALINNEPNDIPIITDLLSAYLQGNRNTIQVQKDSAVFNGVMQGVNSAINGAGNMAMRNPMGALSAGTGLVQGAGNTYLELRGINAKQYDIANTPPQIAKQGSNTAYSVGNRFDGLYIIKKQIKPEYRAKLTAFFKMYGYLSHEVKTPNVKSRQHFNFIKTVGANVTGNVPQDDLAKIKAMFDSGVTLWHTEDVGNYSLANGEV